MYDCLIIGGGPAGLSGALYLARKKMKILLLSQEFGGQTAKAGEIENYLGLEKSTGVELFEKFKESLAKFAIENKITTVQKIQKTEAGFSVETQDGTLETKSILICSGKTAKHLGVPGETEFTGKGVSYCATCDAPLFKDKSVVVVGGGNSALDAALELEKHAKEVTVLNVRDIFQADAVMVDRFKSSPKSKIIFKAKTTEVMGDAFVKGLKYEDQETKEIKELPCEGIFVDIGWTPSTSFLGDLVKLNELSEIEVEGTGATSCAGIYAAGDVTNTPYKQIIIAAGDGAKASLSAWKYCLTK